MLYTAWRSLWARKFRLLMSALSIVLGVAFVSGSLMFTRLLSSGFDEIVMGAFADVNVVPGESAIGGMGNTSLTLDPSVVRQIAGIDGVEAAVGQVTSSQVFVLDTQERMIAFPGAPGIASNWHDTPAAEGLPGPRILEGRAPEADDEVLIDPSTLRLAGYEIGDEVALSTPFDGIRRYQLVGSATYGAGATAGASYVFWTLPEAQARLLQGADAFSSVWIQTLPDADPARIAADAQALLPAGFTAFTGQEVASEIEEQLDLGLGFVNTFLLIFAGVALVVATLLILNTFAILVAQRARELAVLRAIGATRGQVRQVVLFEALVVGVVGAVLGVAVGYGLAWGILAGMRAFGVDLGTATPQLTWQVAAISLGIGVAVTAIAAWLPARRASATRPVEAMTTLAPGGPEKLGAVGTAGIVFVEVGVALLICGVFLNVDQPLWWVGAGAAALLVGLVLAATLVGAPVLLLFGRLFARFFGEPGRLAGLNARRQPRRTSATAATLMIGLSLVTTVAILAASTTTSIGERLTADLRGDILISPLAYQPFDSSVISEAEAVDGVAAAHAFFLGEAALGDEPIALGGVTPGALTDAAAVANLAGTLGADADSAVISSDVAQEHGLALGMLFDVTGVWGTQRLLVTGIYHDDDAGIGDVVVNRDTYALLVDDALVQRIVIDVADGADAAQVQDRLRDVVAQRPTVVVSSVDEYVAETVGQFEQVFAVLYALLALAVVISVLGIVNTLGLSVVERTREIGLLRAVGLTRPQLRRMISLESITVTVLGSLLGVLLGLVFGSSVVWLLRPSGIDHLLIPWGQLAAFVVVAAVFGWLAALGPARRASRLKVLDAIATQ
ncbi:MAG TPA: FtsX-like permease family protein [Arachnia sp.]|nr:FtsX-like permease family protein [Arachnia sp.]HMT85176.1 FtsX-like permease family protein [Arachnia sp.]